MNNLVVRSIAGLIFSVVVICSALLGPISIAVLFLFFATVGLHEFYTLTGSGRIVKPFKWFGLLTGMALYVVLFLIFTDQLESKYLWIFGAIISLLLCSGLIKPDQSVIQDLSYTLMGWLYVILPFALVNLLAHQGGMFDYALPVGFFLILWANDSGAYFVGKFFGKTKLYPKVSPNKTWEGLFGGILFAFVVAYILSRIFDHIAWADWGVISLIISVFANVGDLFESLLKRTVDVKDSGHLIPGHGGVLDRFDGLLISMPIVICYLELTQL